MPAYFPTNTNSDVAGSRLMNSLSDTTSTLQVSLGSLGSTTLDWITAEFYPNSTTAPTGSATFEIIHTVVNMNIGLTAQLLRVNSAGVLQTSGTVTARQVTASSNVFTVGYPSWTGASCTDRIELRLVYNNTAMSNQSCTIGLDRTGTYLLTNLEHNGVGCTVLRKPVWVMGLK
jgi:uncharacterized membrane protein YgdD (TMEM256/DUF423 family)